MNDLKMGGTLVVVVCWCDDRCWSVVMTTVVYFYLHCGGRGRSVNGGRREQTSFLKATYLPPCNAHARMTAHRRPHQPDKLRPDHYNDNVYVILSIIAFIFWYIFMCRRTRCPLPIFAHFHYHSHMTIFVLSVIFCTMIFEIVDIFGTSFAARARAFAVHDVSGFSISILQV